MILGNITFQANDKTDVFHVEQVKEDGMETSDEALFLLEDPQFESDKVWVTGNVPKLKPVHIEGDTSMIHAWFKGTSYANPFVITVYVECEMAEELEEVISEEASDDKEDFLEPIEINL
jgi:hypothetical protein